ncbi:MAG: transaldolase [Syntrophobacteria bacterium]
MNPLKELYNFEQSFWVDYILRSLITSGELDMHIKEDGVRGVTSNPAIFMKAIAETDEYEESINSLSPQYKDTKSLYEQLAIQDIQGAADALRPVYDQSKKQDGYVSLEVSPHLARDTNGTLDEARRLWKTVAKENLMIKVPATPEGIPAIEQLISEGINVNVTLLFSQDAYERVAEAYIAGLEKRSAQGQPLDHVASVASFFISRIDSAIDKLLEEKLQAASSPDETSLLQGVMGKVAIANAKLTYRRYGEIFSGNQWQALADKGAQTQRILWASTSTKNPDYRDVIYVEELIGPQTVNTIPPPTAIAFRDHGKLRESLTEGVDEAGEIMEKLEQAGISMKEVTDRLLEEGVEIFAVAFDQLLSAVEKAR